MSHLILNSLSTWVEQYLAETVGDIDGYHYSPTTPAPPGAVLVTVAFMPEQPADIVTITGYDFPEEGTQTGTLTGRIQVRTRSRTRQAAMAHAHIVSDYLTGNTPRLDRVKRINIQPIGQDQMGFYEVTTNLITETTPTERTLP